MIGAVRICAAREVLKSFFIAIFIFSQSFFAVICFFAEKRIIPRVAAYDSWKEIVDNHFGQKIKMKIADKNREKITKFFLPNTKATSVNIPITAALITGAWKPTNRTNKITISIVIKIDMRLLKKAVIFITTAPKSVIFMPDKTTIWSNPTTLNSW